MQTGIASSFFNLQNNNLSFYQPLYEPVQNNAFQYRESNVSNTFFLPLIQQILQQLLHNNNGNNVQPPEPSSGAPTPQPATELNLSQEEQNIFLNLHAADQRASIPNGYTAHVTDTNRSQNLNTGDQLVIKNANGETISTKTLEKSDMYDLRFRQNMLQTVETLGSGWEFTNDLVGIKNNSINTPETRSYSSNGYTGIETVLERNNYWEVVQRGSNRYLVMRDMDNQGQTIKPSTALNDIFQNRDNYAFDCATPMRLLNLKATLDTIGAEDFDQQAGKLTLSSWYDQHDNSHFDGGFVVDSRTARAGDINVNGTLNLNGETALFDPNKGDRLQPGAAYYFDLPGDNSSAVQGWNAIYTGRTDSGAYRFWSSNMGMVEVRFENNSWIPQGAFNGYYLGAVTTKPDTQHLQSWDRTPSV